MADKKFTHVKVVTGSGEEHLFSEIKDMQINVETGILDVNLADGNFVFMVDSLRYFEVGLTSQQSQPVSFRQCDVLLIVPDGKAGTQEAGLSEKITVKDVINYEWKADQGLLLVFGKGVTLGVHLDHIVSFKVEIAG